MGLADWIVVAILCLVSLFVGPYFTKRAGKQGTGLFAKTIAPLVPLTVAMLVFYFFRGLDDVRRRSRPGGRIRRGIDQADVPTGSA